MVVSLVPLGVLLQLSVFLVVLLNSPPVLFIWLMFLCVLVGALIRVERSPAGELPPPGPGVAP